MAATKTYDRAIIGEDGSIALNCDLLRQANLKPGDEVIVAIEDDHLIIQTDEQLSEQIKLMFSHIPSGVSLAEELIRERRSEFHLEQTESDNQ